MDSGEVTTLLRAWGAGDLSAADPLFSRVYDELRSLAQYHSRSHSGATVTPTALVNEAFLELVGDPKADWRDRAQFFAFTAVVMRRLMIAYARSRGADKRGGGVEPIAFDESIHALGASGVDAEDLDAALTALEQIDAAQAKIVELRFFGGLTVEETAEYLGISPRSVNRQWGMAKAWLADYLQT